MDRRSVIEVSKSPNAEEDTNNTVVDYSAAGAGPVESRKSTFLRTNPPIFSPLASPTHVGRGGNNAKDVDVDNNTGEASSSPSRRRNRS